MPYSNAPEIVDGAALGDNTTLKFLKIAGNISTDLLNQVKIYGSNYSK
ncbi:hypothetical protein [Nostoc sp.]